MTKDQAEKWFRYGAGAATVHGGPLDPIFQAEWERVGAEQSCAECERLRKGIQLALDQIHLGMQRNGLTQLRLVPVVSGLDALIGKAGGK